MKWEIKSISINSDSKFNQINMGKQSDSIKSVIWQMSNNSLTNFNRKRKESYKEDKML